MANTHGADAGSPEIKKVNWPGWAIDNHGRQERGFYPSKRIAGL